jgi:hypothetical protein
MIFGKAHASVVVVLHHTICTSSNSSSRKALGLTPTRCLPWPLPKAPLIGVIQYATCVYCIQFVVVIIITNQDSTTSRLLPGSSYCRFAHHGKLQRQWLCCECCIRQLSARKLELLSCPSLATAWASHLLLCLLAFSLSDGRTPAAPPSCYDFQMS